MAGVADMVIDCGRYRLWPIFFFAEMVVADMVVPHRDAEFGEVAGAVPLRHFHTITSVYKGSAQFCVRSSDALRSETGDALSGGSGWWTMVRDTQPRPAHSAPHATYPRVVS